MRTGGRELDAGKVAAALKRRSAVARGSAYGDAERRGVAQDGIDRADRRPGEAFLGHAPTQADDVGRLRRVDGGQQRLDAAAFGGGREIDSEPGLGHQGAQDLQHRGQAIAIVAGRRVGLARLAYRDFLNRRRRQVHGLGVGFDLGRHVVTKADHGDRRRAAAGPAGESCRPPPGLPASGRVAVRRPLRAERKSALPGRLPNR